MSWKTGRSGTQPQALLLHGAIIHKIFQTHHTILFSKNLFSPLVPSPPVHSPFYNHVLLFLFFKDKIPHRRENMQYLSEFGLSHLIWWSLVPSIFLQTTQIHSSFCLFLRHLHIWCLFFSHCWSLNPTMSLYSQPIILTSFSSTNFGSCKRRTILPEETRLKWLSYRASWRKTSCGHELNWIPCVFLSHRLENCNLTELSCEVLPCLSG
jgi:hypothetical protein